MTNAMSTIIGLFATGLNVYFAIASIKGVKRMRKMENRLHDIFKAHVIPNDKTDTYSNAFERYLSQFGKTNTVHGAFLFLNEYTDKIAIWDAHPELEGLLGLMIRALFSAAHTGNVSYSWSKKYIDMYVAVPTMDDEELAGVVLLFNASEMNTI
jgi:hypothetical protein